MYTQCPDCGTVFRVTARALRAAQGRVRCGICSASFDALEYLSERPLQHSARVVQEEDTITVEELPGTEVIELSGSGSAEESDRTSDSGSFESVDAEGTAEPGAQEAGPEDAPASDASGDGGSDRDDAELEFHGSAADLDRLFVPLDAPRPPLLPSTPENGAGTEARVIEFRRAIERIADSDLSGIEVIEERDAWPTDEEEGGSPPDPAQIAAVLAFRRPDAASGESSRPQRRAEPGAGPARDGTRPEGTGPLDRTDEFPILVLDESDDVAGILGGTAEPGEREEDELAGARQALAGSKGPAPRLQDAPEGPEDEDLDAGPSLYGSPRIPIPAELRRDTALAADEIFASRSQAEPDEVVRRWPWILAVVLLLIGLAAQAAHYWRGELVRHPLTGPWLMRAYGAFGLALAAPADLAAFELRQLGAASDAAQAGRLRVRASIVNGAAFAQPFPLLRLSLQDRFGTTIGTRDLEPAEYLPGGELPPSGLMAPGQRADAEVVFVDPGRDAVGFELDLCQREGPGVRCSDQLPERRR